MSLVPRSLLLLTGLRLRGRWRRFVGSLRTPKGLLLAIATFGLMATCLAGPLLASAVGPGAPARSSSWSGPYAPYVILGLVLLSLVRSPTDRALAFLQPEVDLLFPAPFTRRQLLLYKLLQYAPTYLVASAFATLTTRLLASSWVSVWLAVFLMFWFIHLCALCVALFSERFQRERFARQRRLAVLGIVLIVVIGSLWAGRSLDAQTPAAMLRAFSESTVGMIVAAPTTPLARTFSAPLGAELLLWGGCALAINLGLLLVAIRLDADWMESGVESARRIGEMLEQYRRTGGVSTRGPGLAFVRVPMPPRLGGLGPLAWRQAIGGIRQGARGLVLIAVIVGVIAVPQLFQRSGDAHWFAALKPMGVFLVVYLSLFLPQLLRLDFRGDIDRMDTLKSLPVTPLLVASAQVVVPAVVITSLQVPLALVLDLVLRWDVPVPWAWVPSLFLANVMVAALDNIVFLLWPVRPQLGAGMNFISAQALTQILKLVAVMLMIGVAVGIGAAVATFGSLDRTTQSCVAALVIAALLALESIAALVLLGRLFDRFDPALERAAEG